MMRYGPSGAAMHMARNLAAARWKPCVHYHRMNGHSSAPPIVPIAPIGWNEGGTLRIKGHGIDPTGGHTMKTLTLALATVLGIAFVAPITAAQAETTKK